MTDSLQERYEVAVEYLLGSLPPHCGLAEAKLAAAEEQFGVRLPLALRDYYLAVGNLHVLNDAHDHLLAPKDWFLDAGKLVFLVENQAVVYWAVEATHLPGDDPAVFQGVNLSPEPTEWHPTHDRCSEFLLVILHWQGVCGGLEWLGMTDVGEAALQHFERNWSRVGEVEGLVAFRREGRSACIMGEGEARELYIGASSEERFHEIVTELAGIGLGLNQL